FNVYVLLSKRLDHHIKNAVCLSTTFFEMFYDLAECCYVTRCSLATVFKVYQAIRYSSIELIDLFQKLSNPPNRVHDLSIKPSSFFYQYGQK
ncbi:hypothetical protein ABEW00_22065, partial [Rossellomorea vietnamensis]|uniref:hypothetical protein n=1 Tax=Rossellomorea vietnamensis TaxID=218284 RepID=UPI003D267881